MRLPLNCAPTSTAARILAAEAGSHTPRLFSGNCNYQATASINCYFAFCRFFATTAAVTPLMIPISTTAPLRLRFHVRSTK